MPKAKTILPEYGNKQIKEAIMEYIHDEDDRKMLYLWLANGKTFSYIAEVTGFDEKTVGKRLRQGEKVLFKHIPS